jgi:hypothetical protein
LELWKLSLRQQSNRQVLATLDQNTVHPGTENRDSTEKGEKGKQLKRGADDANLDGNDGASDDGVSGDEIEFTHNCDQVRNMITAFIATGEMKVKDLVNEFNTSSVSYYRFMKQHGPDKGQSTDTYLSALRFFQKRLAKGIPMPRKKRATNPKAPSNSAKDDTKGAASDTKAASSKAASSKAAAATSAATDNIQLDGEMDDAVEVYDSCHEIRKKISAHLRKTGVTQAQFCRELHAQFHGPRKPATVSGPQLNTFRGQKGPVSGNTSCVYYAAYVFFEKERLAAGRPKTQHRIDMEGAWGEDHGVDVMKVLKNKHYFTLPGEKIVMNNLGRIDVLKKMSSI